MWANPLGDELKRVPFLALFLVTSGCSLSAIEDETVEPTKNHCSADSDCPGGACDTDLGVCKSTEGSFSNVLLEVTPPASVSGYGSIGFLTPASELALTGGALDVNIDVVAKVVGTVTPTPGNYNSCLAEYGPDSKNKSSTAPVKVTFTPTAKLLGLSTSSYVTTAKWDETTQTYQFVAWMPADTYDVYIEADPQQEGLLDQSCTIVPQFVYDAGGKQWEIPAGDFTLPLVLQPANQLSVKVPSPVDLTGWTVEIVHPGNGILLSSSPMVGEPIKLQKSGDEHVYVADIEYSKLWDSSQAGKEIVRIRPTPCATDDAGCEEIVGPTLVVERSAVEWATEGQAIIDQLEKLDVGTNTKFPTIKLQAVNLLAGEGFYQGSASVRFVSKENGLDLRSQSGPLDGVQALFDRTITTDTDKFDVELLPGDYDVYVAPTGGSKFATTHTELLVSLQNPGGTTTEVQNGKSITLAPVSHIDGSVQTMALDPAVGAQIQALASAAPPTPLQIVAGASPFKPQPLSGNVDENGVFVLEGDPGTLDFSVRPADGSSFPWLVRPNVEVQSVSHHIGELQVGWPVVYMGSIFLPGEMQAGGAGGSLIRAYIYLDEDGYTNSRDGATSVLQIAETRAAADGSFRLFLPPHLN